MTQNPSNRRCAEEYTVKRGDSFYLIAHKLGVPLRDLRSRRGVLIACILRGDEMIFPAGQDEIRSGDTVIVVTAGGQMNSMKDILE